MASLSDASSRHDVVFIALSAPPEVMYPAIRARAREVGERLPG